MVALNRGDEVVWTISKVTKKAGLSAKQCAIAGAKLFFLPPCFRDLNLIEQPFVK
jgi:transposase